MYATQQVGKGEVGCFHHGWGGKQYLKDWHGTLWRSSSDFWMYKYKGLTCNTSSKYHTANMPMEIEHVLLGICKTRFMSLSVAIHAFVPDIWN